MRAGVPTARVTSPLCRSCACCATLMRFANSLATLVLNCVKGLQVATMWCEPMHQHALSTNVYPYLRSSTQRRAEEHTTTTVGRRGTRIACFDHMMDILYAGTH